MMHVMDTKYQPKLKDTVNYSLPADVIKKACLPCALGIGIHAGMRTTYPLGKLRKEYSASRTFQYGVGRRFALQAQCLPGLPHAPTSQ